VLFDHRAWSAYDGDDERVFANPRSGRPFDVAVYAKLYREALRKAGITDYVRPFHDGRHTWITNAAKASLNPGRPQDALRAQLVLHDAAIHHTLLARPSAKRPSVSSAGCGAQPRAQKRRQSLTSVQNSVQRALSSFPRQPVERLSFWLNGAAQESNLPSVGLPRLTGFEDRLRHRPLPLRAPTSRVAERPAAPGQP
jgi:hypothetical protein